ncbi:MAG: PD-(D/E)XK nuclease family protein [Polyangiales bacterium]
MAVPVVTLLVEPSTHHVDAALRAGLPPGTQVVTLPILEARLAQALLPGLRLASAALSRLLLRSVLREQPAGRALAARAGLEPEELVDAADAALGTLRGAGVELEVLRAAEGRGAALAELLFAHDQALAKLGVIERRSLAARLPEAIAKADVAVVRPALSGARDVEIRDVAALSPARLAWIEALEARVAGRVLIVAPTAQESLLSACGIDDPRERLAARLEERFASSEAPPELVHRSVGAGEGPCAELASALFAEGRGVSAEGHVRLVAAAGVEVAAEVAASEVASALRRGVAPERVVVAMPTLDENIVRPLRRAMRALGIPLWEPRGAPPSASEPVAVLLELLRALDGGARKEHLIERLLSGGPSPRGARIRAARSLAKLAGSDLATRGDALLEGLDESLRAVVSPLLALLRAPPSPSLATALGHVDALATALGFPRSLGRGADSAIAAGDGEALAALAADLAAWSSFAEAISELGRAAALASASEATISWTELARELEAGLEQRRGVPSSRTGAVPLARLRDRLGLDCDVLVILETHDGALPARGTADPLLSRPLLRALRAKDPTRTPHPPALVGAIDLLAALDAIGHTRERVVVVHRGVDEDGRAQLPGALPLEIARVANLRPEVARAHAIPLEIARVPRDLALSAVVRGLSVDPDVRVRAEAETIRARAFADESVRSPFAGVIGDPAPLSAAFGASPASPLSVSAAESLLACPFVVFAERVLRARQDEATPDDGGHRDLGDIAHAALLAIYDSLRDGAVATTDDAAVSATAFRAIDRVFAEKPAATPLQSVRRERLREDLVALVLADLALAREEGRVYFRGEVPFGPESEWKSLALPGEVWVQGRIDRIDVGASYGVVVDYKSTAPAVTRGSFFADKKTGSVQIALYARVAAENLRLSRVLGRFIGYRNPKQLKKHYAGIDRNDDTVWRAQVGDAGGDVGPGEIALALSSAAADARAGFVPPRRGERCALCAQRVACRVPQVVLENEGDP